MAYKSVATYFRTLLIEEIGRDRSAKSWMAVCSGTAAETDELAVRGCLLRSLVQRAREGNLTFQFHMGCRIRSTTPTCCG